MDTIGLRERKRRATHRALAAIALRLATERGFDRVTVEDISRAANVSARTFFNYFASKEDAIVQPYPDYAEHLAESAEAIINAPAKLSPLLAAAVGLRRELARIEADRDDWLVRFAVVEKHPTLLARMIGQGELEQERLLAALAKRIGQEPNDWYPRLVYSVVDGVTFGVVQHWYRNGGTAALVALLDEGIAAVAQGLPAPN